MTRIVVIGHAALDRVYRVAEIPTEPRKVRALEMLESGGGSAANAAVTIARLGMETELWCRVGADEAGARIKAFLDEEGVNTAYVRAFEAGRTATAAVIVDSRGERLVVGERDHAISLDPGWLPMDRIEGASAVLSDLRWLEATAVAFKFARAAGVPTIVDGDAENGDLLREVLLLTDYAIFPVGALEALFPGTDTPGALVRALDLGPAYAGVTKGAEGYDWRRRGGGEGHQPAYAIEAVDTTGAGDAFHGALTWALVEGFDDAECARIGAAVAAMSCRKLGARAGLPSRAEVDDFLRERDGRGLAVAVHTGASSCP